MFLTRCLGQLARRRIPFLQLPPPAPQAAGGMVVLTFCINSSRAYGGGGGLPDFSSFDISLRFFFAFSFFWGGRHFKKVETIIIRLKNNARRISIDFVQAPAPYALFSLELRTHPHAVVELIEIQKVSKLLHLCHRHHEA